RHGHADLPPTSTTRARPADSDAVIAHGQPCRCKHIPLIVAQDGQKPSVERATVDDRHAHDQFLSAPVGSHFGGFASARDAVALLPQPPPSGHLLAISCTVLRC
ncbi:MAG: hypothetical protein ABGY75_15660, partial [Gemmataceae bacterium]